MTPDDRQRLRRLLDTFDEIGLVALANKGLVRRAQKDLEAGCTLEETDTHLLVRGPDWTVTMPAEGPQHAKDDTRATGVTRQILTATLFLRDNWRPLSNPAKEPEDASPLLAAILDIAIDDLVKWTNKTLVREVLALLKSPMSINVQCHAGVTLKAVEHQIELRIVPAKKWKSAAQLLEQILSTAPKALHERWVVTILLAYQIGQGRSVALPDEANEEPAEALRTRQEVLAGIAALLEQMVTTGLAHPSQRMIERLFTLSLSALTVGLPRLSRLVRGLADEVSKILTRDAAGDTQSLLDQIAWTFALARATAAAGPQPSRSLIGTVRSQYEPVGDLKLIGVGAYPWQTASGFEGVTVLFWDELASSFRTWTATRPIATPGRFDLDQVYRMETPWPGGGPPERLSRGRLLLQNARANAARRLSAAAGIEVKQSAAAKPCEHDFPGRLFRDWTALHQYAMSQFPLGLKERNPLDQLVILEPHEWGERTFDEIQQQFCWSIRDADKRSVVLSLPWTGVNETAISFLEAVKPDRDQVQRVVVRIILAGPRYWLEPLSLLSTGTPKGDFVLNPGFDQGRIVSKQSSLIEKLRKKYGRDRVPTTLTPDDEWTESMLKGSLLAEMPPATRELFADLEGFLLRLAEAGVRQLNELHQQRLGELASRLRHAGWSELSDAAAAIASPGQLASGVIWLAYLVRLHRFVLQIQN